MFKFSNLFEKAKKVNPNITEEEWQGKREEALKKHMDQEKEYSVLEDGTAIAGKPSEEQLDIENRKM
jgi:hypothetical protein